jgi:SAM-dependent methyltransferase
MSESTSQALRDRYRPEGGVTAVFSNKVADYAASRPDYPRALVAALARPGRRVVDLGAGTGLLTRALLEAGCEVVAVEPNEAMRAACDAALGGQARYRSVAGTAEATTLPAASADLVTAAQAFHWFQVDAARAECLRILGPGGEVALAWNDRVLSDPLHVALDEVFARFGGAKRGALVAHEDRSDVPRFFAGAPTRTLEFAHEHRLDAAGLRALAFSRSYMPARDSDAGGQAAQALDAVFDRFADGPTVAVRYRTVAIVGRPQDPQAR